MNPPIPVLTGPTAVGKTSLSLDLAEAIGAEVLSADSRQVYRDMTIGTAKPTPRELERVPHHFIDERDLDQPWTAGQFAEAANARIGEILARGHIPLVVGGSTLYLHALQFGLADVPSVPEAVRDELEARLEREGAAALFAELKRVDPKAASSMDATKTQRLVRALEVYHHTGRPLTAFYDEQEPPPYDYITVVLHRERQELYDRINRRVDEMLERGLLDEVRAIRRMDVDRNAPPLRTIGYQEPFDYLEEAISYDEMVRLIKRNSRRYAKRQLTWFRRYEEYVWHSAEELTVSDLREVFNLQ
jgi:tRNA dimethylallyltransferase